jgi:hypothetical protein
MKKIYLYLILCLLLVSPAYAAIGYFSDRMNFPPGESRMHNQTLTNNNADSIIINATIPSNFTISSTNCNQISSGLVSCTISAGSAKYFAVTSPANCTEGTIYKSYLASNSSFSGSFTFVCIPDNKITDCKVEYGHGDANYLSNDQLYISNEPATIFNLLRVWNIGHYLTPNEDAKNATVKCQYENYPVRTYGRVELQHSSGGINGTFLWNEIEGGYWFRIGVVSQDISGKSIGSTYNVTCSNLTYQFEHERVVAESTTCNLEIRSAAPFSCSIINHPVFSSRSIITITNHEKYSTYDLSFGRLLNGATHTETYQQLNSGQSISYTIDNTSSFVTPIFFIPSWYINSLHPVHYIQQLNCTNVTPPVNHPPSLTASIPNQTWPMNTNNTNAFDLDNYFTDIDADNLTYAYMPVANITVVINSTTNIVSFIPNINWTGARNITFYANDSINTTPSNLVRLTVTPCGNNIIDSGEQCDGSNLGGQTCVGLGYAGGTLSCTASCTFDTSGCISPPSPPGGGGGGGKPTPPIIPPAKPEELKQLELNIISYPGSITLSDTEFTLFAEVKNTGTVSLDDVTVESVSDICWETEKTYLGSLGPGERKIAKIKYKNIICSYGCFVFDNFLNISLIAESSDAEDSAGSLIAVNMSRLAVLTDRDAYSEGDMMRLCIIYNNLGQEYKDKLEFELDFLYNYDSHYIIDYLSSFSVNKDKILIVTKDYVLDLIPVTTDYLIDVMMYEYGELFSERYMIARANATAFFNGIIEDQILQRENTVYEFRYNQERHTIQIKEFNDDYVDLIVFSAGPREFRIKLLETVGIDLDGDSMDDISLTYMGLKGDKADIRIKILPKKPAKELLKSLNSYEVGLGEKPPRIERPEIVLKASFFEKLRTIIVLSLFKLMEIAIYILLILLVFRLLLYLFPSLHNYIAEKGQELINCLKKIKGKIQKVFKP